MRNIWNWFWKKKIWFLFGNSLLLEVMHIINVWFRGSILLITMFQLMWTIKCFFQFFVDLIVKSYFLNNGLENKKKEHTHGVLDYCKIKIQFEWRISQYLSTYVEHNNNFSINCKKKRNDILQQQNQQIIN